MLCVWYQCFASVTKGETKEPAEPKVVDFSHLVEKGTFGNGKQEDGDDDHDDEDNAEDKKEAQALPVKPPPLDFSKIGKFLLMCIKITC